MADSQFKVVVVGGGVAALEAALALRDLAADLVGVQLVAPNSEFSYRPLSVREPFAHGAARRYSLRAIASDIGAELIPEQLGWIDSAKRIAHTEQGSELAYDALVLALGARMHAAFAHGLTIDDRHMDELLHGVVQDVEQGYTKSIAFVAPGRMAWPLPIYELALMTARRAYDMSVQVKITIVTPEDAPLGIFGSEVSTQVGEMLADAGIEVITSAYAQSREQGHLEIHPGDRRLDADRVIALPELHGPAVRGLPAGEHGFIRVDVHGQVQGVERVYAAGDATDFPVKFGGIAAQQADAVAQSIAALAGAAVTPEPFAPEIHGILLTGAKPRYLSARITGGHGFSSQFSEEPTWTGQSKVASRYLAPYLAALDQEGAPTS